MADAHAQPADKYCEAVPTEELPFSPAGGPPWLDHKAQRLVQYKSGDVVVSVPSKSGTTWTMNIVHQLRTGGDEEMEQLYEKVRWLEFAQPKQTSEELAKSFETMPMTTEPFRAFKSHGSPPMFPVRPDMKYIVVMRNPCDAISSFYPFLGNHRKEFFDCYGVPPMAFPDFSAYFDGFITGAGWLDYPFWGFLKSWWPYRNNKNVLFMHYANMVKDHEGHVQKVADFLEIKLPEDKFKRVCELTSFKYMKEHGDKYECLTIAPVPIMNSGSMVRNGKVGGSTADGMTAEQKEKVMAKGAEIVGNRRVVKWILDGGDLPIDAEL